MFIDKEQNSAGHEIYPMTMATIKNILVDLHYDWVAEVAIAPQGAAEAFYLAAARDELDFDKVKWTKGLSVTCVMRYGPKDDETEAVCEMAVTFQKSGKRGDHKMELSLLRAVVRAWVEEKAFPNARMAIHVGELLKVRNLHDDLKEANFPAYVYSCNY